MWTPGVKGEDCPSCGSGPRSQERIGCGREWDPARCYWCETPVSRPGSCEACGRSAPPSRCPACGGPARRRCLEDFFPGNPPPRVPRALQPVLDADAVLSRDAGGVISRLEREAFFRERGVVGLGAVLWNGLLDVVGQERQAAMAERLEASKGKTRET